RREIDGADEESKNSGERVWDEQMAVGDDLQTVGVVHGIVGDKKHFRGDEDEEHGETKADPEKGFESGTFGGGCRQCGSCHYSPRRGMDVTRCAARRRGAKGFMFLRLS